MVCTDVVKCDETNYIHNFICIYKCIISTIVFFPEAELPQSIHKVSTKIHKASCVFFVGLMGCLRHLRLLIPQTSELPLQQLLTLHLLSAIALHRGQLFLQGLIFLAKVFHLAVHKQVKNESKRNVERQKIIKTQEQTRLYSYSTLWIQNMALPKSHQFLYFIFENGAMLWTW